MNGSLQEYWNRAQQYLSSGQIAAARAQYEALEARAPDHLRTLLLATQIAWNEDRVRDASRTALVAARAAAGNAAALDDAVRALVEVGEEREAIAELLRATRSGAEPGPFLWAAALHLQRLGLHAEALAVLERVRVLGFKGPALDFYLGQELLYNGRREEAEVRLREAVEQAPAFGTAMLPLVRLRRQTREDNALALIERGLGEAAGGTRDEAALDFARYHTLEDLGRHEEAWEALARGNDRMRKRNPHDAAEQSRYVERCIASVRSENLHGDPADQSGSQPIFVIGLPRSGSTVLERMLGNHSQVTSAGELTTLGRAFQWATNARDIQSESFLARLRGLDFAQVGKRYLEQAQWRAHGKPFFVDKQPPNWWLAGLIPAALPKAKILHLVREPMDVCFSNFRAFCGDDYAYCYDLESIASTWRDYRRLMEHWHSIAPGAILDVRYDALVREPEATLRAVLDFCGLPWEAHCIDIARNSTPVATLSAVQVRSELRLRGVEEWAPYASQMEPLQGMLKGDSGSTGRQSRDRI
ncbi:MAG TPA: sulfotransferase [Rhodanobacteraceae bacterium]